MHVADWISDVVVYFFSQMINENEK